MKLNSVVKDIVTGKKGIIKRRSYSNSIEWLTILWEDNNLTTVEASLLELINDK
jgi:hypothetical protein